MEITPGRAPFSEEEDYTPLRKPKTVGGGGMQQQPSSGAAHPSTYAMGGGMNSGAVGGGGAYGIAVVAPVVTDAYGRTVSPSKLSPFAKEFVPRFGGDARGSRQPTPGYQQPQQQQQQNYQAYQQHAQQRYANGYQPQGQQSAQMYAQQSALGTASVQERLKVGGGGAASQPAGPSGSSGGGKSGNYYHQQGQQHHNNHHQSRYNNKPRYHNPNHHQQHQNHHHQQQAQHHHNKHHHNHHGSGSGGSSGSSDMESIALEYLQTVIQCLNQNPGQFDTIATRFLTIFDGMENNQYVLSVAMEDIFQESIQNPNFRYMGAKLYNLLHMLNLKKDSVFHMLLKCKLDYHQQEVQQYMHSNQQQKVRETALFLAELYMQLRGDDSRIHLIAENIVYSLKQLLTKESSDNVRCLCLTLKLAGYDLTADCAAAMQEIIIALDAINQQSPGKYPLAVNVISLQKNNWGRKISSNSLSDVAEEVAAKSAEPLRFSDEPVFYGPDGRELTSEEADFLSGDASGNAAADDSGSDKDDDDFDPEMDEETEKAYKEFCKLNATT